MDARLHSGPSGGSATTRAASVLAGVLVLSACASPVGQGPVRFAPRTQAAYESYRATMAPGALPSAPTG